MGSNNQKAIRLRFQFVLNYCSHGWTTMAIFNTVSFISWQRSRVPRPKLLELQLRIPFGCTYFRCSTTSPRSYSLPAYPPQRHYFACTPAQHNQRPWIRKEEYYSMCESNEKIVDMNTYLQTLILSLLPNRFRYPIPDGRSIQNVD